MFKQIGFRILRKLEANVSKNCSRLKTGVVNCTMCADDNIDISERLFMRRYRLRILYTKMDGLAFPILQNRGDTINPFKTGDCYENVYTVIITKF